MIRIATDDGFNFPISNNRSLSFKSVFPDDVTAGQTASEVSVQEIDVTELIVRNEGREYIMQHIANFSPAYGIKVNVISGNTSLPYYIDLLDRPLFAESECRVKIKRYKGRDHFFDIADATSFSRLADNGVNFPVVKIPYEIHDPNAGIYVLNLSIMLFNVSVEIVRQVKALAEVSAAFVAALDISPSHAIAAGIILAAQIAFTAALILAFLLLANKLIELLFPRLRYFNGIRFKDLISTACSAIGFTFESDTLDALPGLVFLGTPVQKEAKSIFQNLQNELKGQFYTKGYPTDYDGNMAFLGVFLRAFEMMINGKTTVIDGVVRTERRDYFDNVSGVTVTPGLANQSTREDEYTYNTEKLNKRQYIQYQTDESDINTLDNNNPNDTEVGTKLNFASDPSLDLSKGLQKIEVPFALGTRKEQLTEIQRNALLVLEAIDAGFLTNVSQGLQNHIGALQISQQFFAKPKVLYCETNTYKQTDNYLSKISATALRVNYYSIENILNQAAKVRENVPIPMTLAEYEQTVQTRHLTIDGKNCPVLSMIYQEDDSLAIVNYNEPFDWTFGKIDTFVIN